MEKKCPFCSRLIPADAKKCPYCQEWLTFSKKMEKFGNSMQTMGKNITGCGCLIVIIMIAIGFLLGI